MKGESGGVYTLQVGFFSSPFSILQDTFLQLHQRSISRLSVSMVTGNDHEIFELWNHEPMQGS